VLALVISACSEPGKTASSGFEPARNAQGHPNIQGTWDYRTLTPLERPKEMADKAVFSEEEAEAFRQKAIFLNDADKQRDVPANFDVEGAYNTVWWDFGTVMNENRRTSLIIDPPDGRLPDLTPEASEAIKQSYLHIPPVRELGSIGMTKFRPAGPEALGLSERCLMGFNAGPPLTPSAYNNNIRIVQAPDHILLFTEMVHNARIVQMDGREQLPVELKEWSGNARGHWEGDTLIVETNNFTNKTAAFQLPFTVADPGMSGAVGIGKNMQLTERFTLISEDRLVYEYTVNAPDTFTKPFTVAIPMRATDDQIFEYACHEGNHSMPGMLKGARQLEKEAAMATVSK
jgi:hypothetical protein